MQLTQGLYVSPHIMKAGQGGTHDLNCLFAISLMLFGLWDKETTNRMDRNTERLLKTQKLTLLLLMYPLEFQRYAMANKDWNSYTLASDAVALRCSPKVNIALIGQLGPVSCYWSTALGVF